MTTATTIIYRSGKRGHANYGWLNARYSFSFANYYNPENIHFGALRVLNDDIIQPAMGFGTHPHDNMEIITIPLYGSLMHEDSMGHRSEIHPGEVQVMSAGSGIRHSEFNASPSEELNLFQIWIFPDQKNVTPRYDQKKFPVRVGSPTLLVSPDGRDGSLFIHQEAFISRIELPEGESFTYPLYAPGNGVFAILIDGEVTIGEDKLHPRDAITIENTSEIHFKASVNSDLLVLEVPL